MRKAKFYIDPDKDLEWQGRNLEKKRDAMLYHYNSRFSKRKPSYQDIVEIDKVCNKIWSMIRNK